MASGYSITITAVDKATGTFDGLNKRVEALNKRIATAAAPFKKLEESFAKFTKVTGLDKIATGFKDVAKAGTETFRSLLRVVEPLAAITGAASLAGLYRLTTAWGEFGTQLGQQATRAGLAADQLQTLQNAARLAGISADTLTQGMTALNDKMGNAAYGEAPEFISALISLGLTYDDIKKKTPTEALKILADKIAAIQNPTVQAAEATALFGSAGEGMLPFLRKGSSGIDELSTKAATLGGTLGKEGVDAADRFRQSQESLRLAVEGLGNAIGQQLGPAIGPLLDQMASWIAANRDWISTGIGDAAREFGDYLKSVDWASVGHSISQIASDVQSVATALGGWKEVGEGLIVFFAGRFLVQMMLPFAKITAAFLSVPKEAAAAALKADAELAKIGTKPGGLGRGFGISAAMGPLGIALDTLINGIPDRPLTDEELREALQAGKLDPAKLNEEDWQRANTPPPVDNRPWYQHPWDGPKLFGNPPPVKPIPLPTGQARENALSMAEVFAQHGYSKEGTAALLGSAAAESGFNPRAGLGTGHVGGFQWSDTRQGVIEKRFGKKVEDMTPAEQAEAAAWEIDNNPSFAAVRAGVKQHDLVAANDVVTRQFEAPGNYDKEVPNRLGLSRGVFASLPSGDAVAPPPAPVANGTPGANGKVDMNVKVTGSAQVTATSSGDIGLKVEQRDVARDGY